MDDGDSFRCSPLLSTYSIFYYNDNDNASNLGVFTWSPLLLPIIGINPSHHIICSSSNGLVACRNIHNINTPNGRLYCVGNPYIGHDVYGIDPDPPNHHDPNNTHVVLSVGRGAFGRYFFLTCVIELTEHVSILNTYDSFISCWHKCVGISQGHYGRLVPNSGVSVGRMAFWLRAGSPYVPISVYSVRLREDGSLAKASALILPPFPIGRSRIQLGRAMGTLGVVIVNEVNSTVGLFALQPGTNDLILQRHEVFNVQVSQEQNDYDAEENSIARWRQGDMTLVCRAMPRPIKFDSYKVELYFWVQGRVLMLENDNTHGIDSHEYWLRVYDGAHEMPASIIDGIPYAYTDYKAKDCFHVIR